jgi:hypothetical protein
MSSACLLADAHIEASLQHCTASSCPPTSRLSRLRHVRCNLFYSVPTLHSISLQRCKLALGDMDHPVSQKFLAHQASIDTPFSIWVGVWLIICALTYFPDSRRNRIQGMAKRQVLKRLDWIGAASSIAGVTLM